MTTTHTKTYKFVVNEQQFETDRPSLTGSEIRALAQIPADYQLFLEVPGQKKEDRLVGDHDVVDLAEPGIQKLYTVPPATFGYCGPR